MSGYDRIPMSPLPRDDPLAASSSRSSSEDRRDSFVVDGLDEKLASGHSYETSAESSSTTDSLRTLTRNAHTRQLRYFLVLLCIAVLTLVRTYAPSSSSSAVPLSSPHALHPTLVGPRASSAPEGKALYTSCTADELLGSLRTAKIREDGLSRFPNFTKPESIALAPFEWSYDFHELPSGKVCELPRVFKPAEACELLSSFGGVYLTGDSFIRHLHSALLMLLRGRNDGAVVDYLETDDCRADMLFDDGKLCRQRVVADTDAQKEVCGGLASLMFVQTYKPDKLSFTSFRDWRERLSPRQQVYSPVYITGVGGHMNYDTSTLVPTYLDSLFSTLSHHFPSPLNLFAGPHIPGTNQPKMFKERQGPHKVRAYREEVPLLLAERSKEKEMYRGAARYVDFYESTDGAVSFDGVHYSYQVNMEKTMVFLNLLDIAWGEIVAAGGMVASDAEQ
ncbi:hypothetical protein JCM6882_007794 [Rhodosporidiobolus microsporus]